MLQLGAWLIGFSFAFSGNTVTGQPFPLFFGSLLGLVFILATWALGFMFPRIALNIAAGGAIGSAIAVVVNLYRSDFSLIPSAIICSALCYLGARGGQIRLQQV